MTQKTKFYPLTHEEWLHAIDTLKPAQREVLFYIRTLQPFADGTLDLVVKDVAKRLDMHVRTLKRCLEVLKERGWLIDIEVHTLTITLPSCPKVGKIFLPKGGSKDPGSGSKDPDPGSFDPPKKNEPAASKGSSDRNFTNNRSKNLNQNIGDPPEEERGWFGQILAAIEDAGIRANKTIQAEIDRLIRDVGFAAAARRVDLALGSLEEQRAKGILRNPGGFFKRALERCFTPNEDGYRRRSPQPPVAPSAAPPPAAPSSVEDLPTAPSAAPPPAAPSSVEDLPTAPPAAPQVAIVATAPPPPVAEETPINPVAIAPPRLSQQALLKFQQWVDVHLLRGDRASVLERLQSALESGYAEDVGELLWMRKDWKIHLGGSRLIDIS